MTVFLNSLYAIQRYQSKYQGINVEKNYCRNYILSVDLQKDLLVYLIYINVYGCFVCIYVCTSEEGTGYYGATVIDGVWVLGFEFKIFGRVARALN